MDTQSVETTSIDWLTPKAFAKESGLSLATVYRYLASGALPKFQPAGQNCRIAIPRSALCCLDPQAALPGIAPTTSKTATAVHKPTHLSGPAPAWTKSRRP